MAQKERNEDPGLEVKTYKRLKRENTEAPLDSLFGRIDRNLKGRKRLWRAIAATLRTK